MYPHIAEACGIPRLLSKEYPISITEFLKLPMFIICNRLLFGMAFIKSIDTQLKQEMFLLLLTLCFAAPV